MNKSHYLYFDRVGYAVTECCIDHWVKQPQPCPSWVPAKQSK